MAVLEVNSSNTKNEASGLTTVKQNRGGLEGVVAATTALSKVEGAAGRLIYRGYSVRDLAHTTTFEEIAHLLWFGHLPNRAELSDLKARLAAERTLPEVALAALRILPPETAPMDALRTAISAWGACAIQNKPTLEQAIALTARFPLILAAFYRLRIGLDPLDARPELGNAANYLYLMHGRMPAEEFVRALDSYMVMLSDHGMNASTFTARVVASTESDMASAIVAAIGALKGPLHGGAPSKVLDMLRAIGTIEQSEEWLRDTITGGGRLMGFGHRIYKTTDPRSEELKELARLANSHDLALAKHVEERALALLDELKPGHEIHTNVEFYSSVVLDAVGLPGDFFTPTFAASRIIGWTAHVLEQSANNRLIRPNSDYIGPLQAHFVPIDERSN